MKRSLTLGPGRVSRRALKTMPAMMAMASVYLLLLASSTSAQDWRGHATIRGMVLDENEEPIEGAKVTVTFSDSGRGPKPVLSKRSGQFAFVRLASGNWTVIVEAEGYATDQGSLFASAAQQPPIRVQLLELGSAATSRMSEEEKAAAEARAAAVEKVNEGNELILGGRFAEARAAYLESLEGLESANHAPVLANIARSYVEEGNNGAAIESLEKALAADPDHVDSLKLIAQLLATEGRQDEAEEYVARLPEDEAADPNELLNAGIALYNRNDLDGALEKFNAAVAIAPNVADVYYYRGLVLMAKQSNPEALADFERLLELAPDHPNASEAQQFIEYLKSL